MSTNELRMMSVVIASPASGGGMAMMGILVLIGAVAGLVYLVKGRR